MFCRVMILCRLYAPVTVLAVEMICVRIYAPNYTRSDWSASYLLLQQVGKGLACLGQPLTQVARIFS
jgi:hypothetical protein